ncbi:monovalent cation/H(+) antiporter subunit G [Salinigranum halophilum]|jgi:multicomponent Na+:H+ antiporter subunit G|uniref:monovalent cation/H(+) antiporter subunit G n=1 Tax=Salinigranum halophilum TaxID=2565931 RepID=UPI0010A75A6D|nr:monovalent cation/H(+) antiporter subunit G [Salinigranum halophilum]
MTPTEIAVVVLAAGGVFFATVAAVGLVRLPDLYTRAHATSKSETLGAVLTLAAVALVVDAGLSTLKAGLLLLFMFLTNPTAAHAITRAAAEQGIEPWTVTTDAESKSESETGTEPDAETPSSTEVDES